MDTRREHDLLVNQWKSQNFMVKKIDFISFIKKKSSNYRPYWF